MDNNKYKNMLNFLLENIAEHSPDPKKKVACAIVDKNDMVLSYGYNRNPFPLPQERDSLESGKSGFLHAEEIALLHKNDNLIEKKLFCTLIPCTHCAKLIIEAGDIFEVIYQDDVNYSKESLTLFEQANIKVVKYEESVGNSTNMLNNQD